MAHKTGLQRDDLIHPELSYQIVGVLFEVYNTLGSGYQERYYQRALALALKDQNISFREQVYVPLHFKDNKIGNYYLDFLIEDKIVLEIKTDERFSRKNIEQVYGYLRATGLELGILANFTKSGVKFRRILHCQEDS